MAIMISAKGRPAGLFGRAPTLEAMAKALTELTQTDAVTTASVQRSGGLTVRLCPTAYMTFWPENAIWRAESDAQVAGPGAHAACYDLLDRLAEMLSMKWSTEDPAGYGADRDFEKLRAWHIRALRQDARAVDQVDNTVERPVRFLNWPKNSKDLPMFGSGVVTPMGWFENGSLAARAWQDAEALALDVLIWPNRAKDGWYWRNNALWTLWNHVSWTSEMSGEEKQAAQDACHLLEKAAGEDEWIPLPRPEYEELCALLGRKAIFWRNPPMQGVISIGYRKQDYRYTLGEWTAVADGLLEARYPAKNMLILERDGRRIRLEALHEDLPPLASRGFLMTMGGVRYEGRVETDGDRSTLIGQCTRPEVCESLSVRISWPAVYDDRWARMILTNIRPAP